MALALRLAARPTDGVLKLCDGQGHTTLAPEHRRQVAVWRLAGLKGLVCRLTVTVTS